MAPSNLVWMRLDYLAHSCFLLESEGYRVLFDPYHPRTGYPAPRAFNIDLVIVSHDHFDHDAVDQVNGRCTVVRGVARRTYGPLTVSGEVGWHGEGDHCDPVSLTVLEWNDRRLAHFGDLGRGLTPEQKRFFQGLDLLLIPCGGDYTIDGANAAALVRELKPKVVVPMHYATPFLNRELFPGLETAESFLSACRKFATIKTERSGSAHLDKVWAEQDAGTTVLNLQHQMA